MSDFRVASRYAKSLLDLAVEKSVLDRVNQDMILLEKTCQKNRDFTLMLKNPVISHDKKFAILKRVFEGKVHPITLSIFEITSRKNREDILPEVAKVFHSLYNQKMGITRAKVTTTFKLDQKLRDRFIQIVKDISHKNQVELEEEVNDDLIGGYILNIEDKQIDDSLHTKLQELKLSLKS